MELAYVAPGKKTAIAASSTGELWGGYVVPEPVVAEANNKEENRGKQANLWMGKPLPDTTAGPLMCPSHGKLCNKGICSGMSRLMREERKKREVERGRGGGRRRGFCSTFGSLLVFNFSYLLLFVIPLNLCYMLPTYYFGAIGPRSWVNRNVRWRVGTLLCPYTLSPHPDSSTSQLRRTNLA